MGGAAHSTSGDIQPHTRHLSRIGHAAVSKLLAGRRNAGRVGLGWRVLGGRFLVVFPFFPIPSAKFTTNLANGFAKVCNLRNIIKAGRGGREVARRHQLARGKFGRRHKATARTGAASVHAALHDRVVHGLLSREKLLHRGRIEPGNTAAGEALTRVLRQHATASACKAAVGHVATVGSVFGRLVVVDGLVASSKAHSVRVMLLNLLGDQADLGARVALVVIAVDRLAIEGLTDRLDVFLQAFIGEEATRLCGCRRGALRRAGAKGDVGRQLKLLVWQRLLLKELVVFGGVLGLIGGLLDLTGGHLSRSA